MRRWPAGMRRVTRFLAVALVAACADELPMEPASWMGDFEVVASEPQPIPVGLAAPLGYRASPSGGDGIVYVSLPPWSVAGGRSTGIRNLRNGFGVTADVVDGGFDPVAVVAAVGDSIEVVVTDSTGARTRVTLAVVARRPPVVIRTVPPRGATDVPLNTRIVVVFSEPMDPRSVGAAIRLLRGGSPVAGSVVLTPDGLRAHFAPDTLLVPATDYVLHARVGATDVGGDSLGAPTVVDFHTTAATTPFPVASVTVVPDTGTLPVGATLTLRATVKDALGNELAGNPVTWTTSAASVVSVTASLQGSESSALVTGIAVGSAVVRATSGGRSGDATIRVTTGPSGDSTGDVASVTISPESVSVPMGDSRLLCPTVRNRAGDTLAPLAAWRSADPVIAVVPRSTSNGVAIGCVSVGTGGRGEGTAVVSATAGGISGTATVTIGPPRPVASVVVEAYRQPVASHDPGPALTRPTVVVGDGMHLRAIVRDPSGDRIYSSGWYFYPRAIRWQSADANVAGLDEPGRTDNANGFTAVGSGSTDVTATIEGVTGGTAVRVPLLRFSSLATADQPVVVTYDAGTNTCGVTPDSEVYCWGDNFDYQLLTPGLQGSVYPLPFGEGRLYSAVSTYGGNTCVLSASGEAYCAGWSWGWDSAATQPVPIPGGVTFTSVAVAALSTCGLTAAGDVYCWSGSSPQPQAVAVGLGFVQLAVDAFFTSCALTAAGAVYCWGTPGRTPGLVQPVALGGGLTFMSVDVGRSHACGVTTAGDAYCWGDNQNGQLGTGTTVSSQVPVLVSGGLKFTAISAGGEYVDENQTCGITVSGAAYCWGSNGLGQLGDGSTVSRLAPTAVSGSLTFSSISVGGRHTCGVTTAGVAYCWGSEDHVPVRVPGQP